jgi:hypothetical protein
LATPQNLHRKVRAQRQAADGADHICAALPDQRRVCALV